MPLRADVESHIRTQSIWRRVQKHAVVDADDLAQTARLAVLRVRSRYDARRADAAPEAAYLAPRIAGSITNAIRTEYSHQEKRRSPEKYPEQAAPGQSPEQAAAGAQLRKLLAESAQTLVGQERAVFWLIFERGKSQAQAAAKLGVSEGRISQIKQGALVTLRAELKRRGIHSAAAAVLAR